MPRDLPIGNGSLLVNFDQTYQIRDLFWPHVGQQNHTLGHTFRVGVWVEGQFRWLGDSGWERDLHFDQDTLVTRVRLRHPALALTLEFADIVAFHESLLVRRCRVTDEIQRQREVRIFFHHDWLAVDRQLQPRNKPGLARYPIYTTSSWSFPGWSFC